MKTKLLSILLAVTILFTLTAPAFAASLPAGDEYFGLASLTTDNSDSAVDATAAAKNVYENLTPTQQQEFLALIETLAYQGDTRLVKYHKTYVDPSYEFEADGVMPQAVAVSAATDVAAQLQALNLPDAVYYALLAFATSLGVPVGNVVDLVIGLGLAAIIVANWDAISNVWQDIVDIFVNAFGSVVQSAFDYINTQIFNMKFNKSAKDAVNGADSNKQNHILNNNLHNHNWNNLFNGKDPKWSDLAPILIKVLQEGSERVYNDYLRVYERVLPYKGYNVVVRFIKTVDGLVQALSTAYIE